MVMCRLQVYTGKNLDSCGSDVGLCTRVVLELMSVLENYHKELFTDNYYTSPTLYMILYNSGVNACGTVRDPARLSSRSWLLKLQSITMAIMTLGLMVHCLQLCG